MKTIKYSVLISLLLFFISCEENYDITEEEIIKPTSISLVKANIEGDLVDMQGNAVPNASVELLVEGTEISSTQTDNEGHYAFEGQGISTSGTILRAIADSKISSVQLIQPYARTSNYYPTSLMDIEDKVSVAPSNEMIISASDFTFKTKAEDLTLLTTGDLNIHTSYFNRTELKNFNSASKMTLDETQWIELVGLLDIRIEDNTSEEIKLAEGRSIEVELNESLEQSEGIYTWHLNEKTGRWLQGPQVTFSGGKTKFNVEQIGMIALGRSLDRVRIKGFIKKENLEPLYKAKIVVSKSDSDPQSVFTNSDGKFSLDYYSNEKANIRVEIEGYELYSGEIAAAKDGTIDDIILRAASIGDPNPCLSLTTETDVFTCSLTLWPGDLFLDNSYQNGTNFKFNIDGQEITAPTEQDPIFNSNALSLTKTVNPYQLEFQNSNGNIQKCSGELTVMDNTPPIAIVDNKYNFSLGGFSSAKLFAGTINENSYDTCSEVTLAIARLDSCSGACKEADFKDYVEFFSTEIGQSFQVILRVSDESGNANQAMGNISILE